MRKLSNTAEKKACFMSKFNRENSIAWVVFKPVKCKPLKQQTNAEKTDKAEIKSLQRKCITMRRHWLKLRLYWCSEKAQCTLGGDGEER
jgi:hypothetical protein